MFEPTSSTSDKPELKEHYMTFLEMVRSENKSSFSKPNEQLPSKSIGKCASCPAWEFSSLTEAKRHVSILHRNYKKALPSTKEKQYVCKVKTCGLVFSSYHKLNAHKNKENHFVRKNAKKNEKNESNVVSKKKNGVNMKRKLESFFNKKRNDHENGQVEGSSSTESQESSAKEKCDEVIDVPTMDVGNKEVEEINDEETDDEEGTEMDEEEEEEEEQDDESEDVIEHDASEVIHPINGEYWLVRKGMKNLYALVVSRENDNEDFDAAD